MNVIKGLAHYAAPTRVLPQDTPQTPVLTERTCLRCGKVWWPRGLSKPKRCPRCKTPYWDRPRRGKLRRAPADWKALTNALQEKVRRELGINLTEQSSQAPPLVTALRILKEMKTAGLSWQEMSERVEREFGVRLEKEQLKALVR